jgi:integrase
VTNTPASPGAPQQANVEAALLVLKSMGLSLEDLAGAPSNRPPVPTFAEYVPVVAATLTGSTLRAYSSYWKRTVEQWGDRRLDEPTTSEIKKLVAYIKANAVQRRNSRGGGHAAENLISALRCLYNHAVDDGLIDEKDNPARKVAKPRRLPSTRRALDGAQLAEINRIVTTTGNDPELDALILRLHTETACRRGGALALRPRDLDREQCLVLLREKGETFRWQPVSPTLMTALVKHAEARNAPSDGGLLRYRNGHQVTDRRYDQLWVRIGRELPWFRNQGISTHREIQQPMRAVAIVTDRKRTDRVIRYEPSPIPTPRLAEGERDRHRGRHDRHLPRQLVLDVPAPRARRHGP